MNNDLITKHFPRKPKSENNHVDRPQEQGSSERQRQLSPPTPITPPNKKDPPASQTHASSLVSSNNSGPTERIPSQQSNSSMRNVFLSLVAALNVHKDISTQPQSIQEDHEEARSQIETVIAGEGIQLWQEFCASREYEDDDQVTPEKLLEYVDLICLPYDNMQQDATNRNRSYPQLVLSLQVLVRPVLQHWVQKAGVLKADHTFTEEKTAVDEGWEDCGLDDYGLDDYGDMDYQSECEPETSRGAYTANIVDVLDDHKDGDRSRRNVDGRESVSRLELTKKEQNSLDILSKDAAANFVEGASTPLSLVWTPGRYKADEFQAPPIYHRPYAIETIGPTIDIGISDNVVDILEEWRFGLNGTQAIQDLNRQYGTRWRRKDQDFRYQIRITVVREFKRLVTDEGMDDDEAIRFLVTKQGSRAITTFYKELCSERATRRRSSEKGKAIPRRDSSTSRVPFDPSSSSSDATRVSTSSAAPGPLTPKKTGGMKQTTLWALARPTADNHQAENAPASEATGGLSAWYIGHKTKALQYCAPTPGMPEVWDSVALDRTYRFPIFDDIVTVEDLWKFWTQGWQDGPSVRERSAKHGATWRKSTYDRAIFQWYAPRYKVVREVQKLVDLQWSEEEATEGIEVLRMREELSLEGLARHLESLYDIRAAISNAKRPNALSVLMSLAKSADACKRESSKPAPLMGHVGGRYTPRTHMQSNAAFLPDMDSVEAEPRTGARVSSPMAGYSGETGAVASMATERRRRSTPTRRRGSRSPSGSPGPSARRNSSSISVSSVTMTRYLTGQRHPRMSVKKET